MDERNQPYGPPGGGQAPPPPPPPMYPVTSDIPPSSPYHYSPAPTSRRNSGILGGILSALLAVWAVAKYALIFVAKVPALATLLTGLIAVGADLHPVPRSGDLSAVPCAERGAAGADRHRRTDCGNGRGSRLARSVHLDALRPLPGLGLFRLLDQPLQPDPVRDAGRRLDHRPDRQMGAGRRPRHPGRPVLCGAGQPPGPDRGRPGNADGLQAVQGSGVRRVPDVRPAVGPFRTWRCVAGPGRVPRRRLLPDRDHASRTTFGKLIRLESRP